MARSYGQYQTPSSGGGSGYGLARYLAPAATAAPAAAAAVPGIAAAPALGPWMIGGAAISGLAGWLQTQSEQRAEEARRGRATTALSGYAYTPYGEKYQPYASPLQGAQESALAQFLSGELTPGQQSAISFQRRKGQAGADVRSAARGTPGGGRAALDVQLERDLLLGAAGLSAQQQQIGLQAGVPYEQLWGAESRRPYEYGLAEWMRGQEAEMRRKTLLAQYG